MEDISSANGFAQWFFFFLVVFWFGSVGLKSLSGGWARLASRFRGLPITEGETFRFVSMYIRAGVLPVGYRGCLHVTVTPAGLGLSIWLPFRFLHPPLFIPWSAVSNVQTEELSALLFTAVHLRELEVRLLFSDPIGGKVMDAFNARFSTMPA